MLTHQTAPGLRHSQCSRFEPACAPAPRSMATISREKPLSEGILNPCTFVAAYKASKPALRVVPDAPATSEAPEAERAPTCWERAKYYIAKFLSPFNVMHIARELKDNIRMYKEAKAASDAELHGDRPLIEKKMELRFAAAIALSETIGSYICAPLVGIGLQELSKNPYFGVFGTIIGDYVPAMISFQLAWYSMNAGYYKKAAKSALGKVWKVEKDLVKFHLGEVLSFGPAYLSEILICGGLIKGLEHHWPHIVEKLHFMPYVYQSINFVVAETIFLLMTAVVNRVSGLTQSMTGKYSAYLDSTFRMSSDVPESRSASCVN